MGSVTTFYAGMSPVLSCTRACEWDSQKLLLYSKAGGGRARVNAQFIVDRGQVGIDRARADDKVLSHLGVGQSLCHQA